MRDKEYFPSAQIFAIVSITKKVLLLSAEIKGKMQ
jgi:hypothetical protein